MEPHRKPIATGHSPSPGADMTEMIAKIRTELCEQWLPRRVEKWGPLRAEENAPPSWTASITAKIGTTVHYITCPGHVGSEACGGFWSRRSRSAASKGLHCVYGGWVFFNGNTITDVQPIPSCGAAEVVKRKLPDLRRLWAEHVLSTTAIQSEVGHVDSTGILDPNMLDQVREMVNKATAHRDGEGVTDGRDPDMARAKHLGKGSGGWTGVTENGTVLKRDSGARKIGNHNDRYDSEPGGVWRRGDLEVWFGWSGWSCFVSRDSRWRPAYHLELLLANMSTAIDYGTTRAAYRDWQASWMQAAEWLWLNVPLDVTQRCVEVMNGDAAELIKTELQRVRNLKPKKYVPDQADTPARMDRLLRDRAGGFIAYHTVGDELHMARGIVAAWAMCALNDILDYERDILCGETNNLVRSLTSDQQVVDAAACILDVLQWAMDSSDYDLADSIVGTNAFYLVFWRYNVPRLARYDAINIQHAEPNTPPELEQISKIVRPGMVRSSNELSSYGMLYSKVKAKVRQLYWGCSCSSTQCEGHDAWRLLARLMDDGADDDIEEALLLALVALNNGANDGDLGCECGMDLLLYEGFVRFFDPETGIVARMHYRTGILDLGNTVTE
ncbi:hypothetical protein Purlil1_179 [Purpureocillium lilacinum]|uniref:Uncharacterized protein n=1 Tax=Purpureocillium lilacinum TaxID=33203 RepID=A0ABR0CG41_PURLI|nr:hypothetical protein Purlil1_179 [Purpureocillium lilacinum]